MPGTSSDTIAFELVLPGTDEKQAGELVQLAQESYGAALTKKNEQVTPPYQDPERFGAAFAVIPIVIAGVIAVLGVAELICRLQCGSIVDLRGGKVKARKECEGLQRGVTVVVKPDGTTEVVRCEKLADIIKAALGGSDKSSDNKDGAQAGGAKGSKDK